MLTPRWKSSYKFVDNIYAYDAAMGTTVEAFIADITFANVYKVMKSENVYAHI